MSVDPGINNETQIRTSRSSPDGLWFNNEIQFARLICELAATQPLQDMNLIKTADSMDLSMDEVSTLFDRAHEVWEASKTRVRKEFAVDLTEDKPGDAS